ncbi:MAG TPA: GTPase ObgE [Synergistales bacterium]|nr:GTPase ObgE [Synergistales bacterium]
MKFIDLVRISVHAGRGGNGCLSFRREKFVPKGGPDGANGGNGGSVILEASSGLHTLADYEFKKRFNAEHGEHGRGKNQVGKNGKDLIIHVPCGTIAYDADTNELLGDLVEPGEKVVIAKGGRGGHGNAYYANSVRRAPRFAEKGEEGQERRLVLELKLIADVGLVGMPNAGKSSLLKAISNANPKIEGYPFTTLSPNLGILAVDDERIVVADVPGLIEGASENRGLGIYFLRHVERTRVLIHVLDLAATDSLDQVIRQWEIVREEFAAYNSNLLERPYIVVGNKTDLLDNGAIRKGLSDYLKCEQVPLIFTSALNGEGIQDLIAMIVDTVRDHPRPHGSTRIMAPLQDPVPIRRSRQVKDIELIYLEEENAYRVVHPYLEKAIQRFDFDHEDAIVQFARILKKFKVEEKLEKAGAKEGDTIYIGEIAFEFQPERAMR